MAPRKKKVEKEKISCSVCVNSKLMQWGNDPVIAECLVTGDMDVASFVRSCQHGERTKRTKHIDRYPKHYGITSK